MPDSRDPAARWDTRVIMVRRPEGCRLPTTAWARLAGWRTCRPTCESALEAAPAPEAESACEGVPATHSVPMAEPTSPTVGQAWRPWKPKDRRVRGPLGTLRGHRPTSPQGGVPAAVEVAGREDPAAGSETPPVTGESRTASRWLRPLETATQAAVAMATLAGVGGATATPAPHAAHSRQSLSEMPNCPQQVSASHYLANEQRNGLSALD